MQIKRATPRARQPQKREEKKHPKPMKCGLQAKQGKRLKVNDEKKIGKNKRKEREHNQPNATMKTKDIKS
jgi:hypothetical protein